MSSTITLTVPHAETETLFLRYVVQVAIRAYRDDLKNHKVKPETVPVAA